MGQDSLFVVIGTEYIDTFLRYSIKICQAMKKTYSKEFKEGD